MLEPEMIRNRRFSTVKNGCDPREVSEFLAEIAAEAVSLLNAYNEDEEKIVKLVEKINEYREDEDAIKAAMIFAQKESNKLINDAKAKARDMIESAKTEQVRLTEQSAADCERIIEEHKANCAELIRQQTESAQAEIIAIKENYEAEKEALREMRAEVTYFKTELTELYSKQLALIMQIPQMEEDELSEYEEELEEEYEEEDESQETVSQQLAVDEKTAEQKHIDEVLNTASFEPIIPKTDAADLQFGKNTR